MNKVIQVIIVSVLLSVTSLAFASKNNFQFQVDGYHTKRQGGQTLNVYVRYALKDNADYSSYPDYRELRTIAMRYLEPTDKLPENTFWEIIAAKLGEELMSRYPFSGVSVQFLVHPNDGGAVYEPGFHGPIYTIGDVIPLTQVVMPVSQLTLKQ